MVGANKPLGVRQLFRRSALTSKSSALEVKFEDISLSCIYGCNFLSVGLSRNKFVTLGHEHKWSSRI